MADAGYDAPRIAHLVADLPVQILGRMHSPNRANRLPATSAPPANPRYAQ